MIDNLELLRIPGFRVLEPMETGETHAIVEIPVTKWRNESHFLKHSKWEKDLLV